MKDWYLIAYDIRDDRRLRRVAKTLEGYGTRLQFSVFRCRLTVRDMERLRWELSRIVQCDDDVLFLGLCRHCVARLRERDGGDTWAEESDLVIV